MKKKVQQTYGKAVSGQLDIRYGEKMLYDFILYQKLYSKWCESQNNNNF